MGAPVILVSALAKSKLGRRIAIAACAVALCTMFLIVLPLVLVPLALAAQGAVPRMCRKAGRRW